jgi:predicted ATPase with chaperone activity
LVDGKYVAREARNTRSQEGNIAHLAGADKIAADHISEAIQHRSLDRQLWT